MKRAVVIDVASHYQLLCAISYCAFKQINDLTVHIIPNMNGIFMLSEGLFQVGGVSVRVVHQVKSGGWAEKFVRFFLLRIFERGTQSNSTFLGHHSYFKPQGLRFVDEQHLTTFSIEEGIGTHGNLRHHLRAARLEGLRFPIAKYCLKKVLSKRIFVDECWGFINDRKSPGRNGDHLVDTVKKLVHARWESGQLVYSSFSLASADEGKAVIFSSPLVRLGIVSAKNYKEIIEAAVRILRSQGAVEVYVKPHPVEHDFQIYDECGIKLIPAQLPGEIVLGATSWGSVVGFNSGILILAKKVFGYDSYSLNNLVPADTREKVALEGELGGLFDSYVSYIG